MPRMKFLGQCFYTLEHDQDRQTDVTEHSSSPYSLVVIILRSLD